MGKLRQYFGTDGIRGKTGQFPITPEFALKLGWAVGCVLQEDGGLGPVLISKDTRLSGYLFESALESGLVAAGVEVYQLGPMPTPAVAYLTRSLRGQAGIVISASHNLYQDNGFKFFSAQGTKFSQEWELRVEEKLKDTLTVVESHKIGRAHRLTDVHGRYIEFCKSTFSRDHDLRGLKVVLDCANGATYQVAPTLFRELGMIVSTIGDKPNGLNINAACGSTSPELLQETVLAQKADLGIAFDGDGDRLVMVDHLGQVQDGDQLLYILARSYASTGRLLGGVVGTVMSNLGLELALKDQGIDFIRSKVGDKHVLEALVKKGWNLGGETSGHLICLDKTTTGDGIIGSLQVIQAMCERDAPLQQLGEGMQRLSQVLLNVAISQPNILEHPKVSQVLQSNEKRLAGRGRIVLRASGTESLIRVMVEGEDKHLIQSVAEELVAVLEEKRIA
jgi:phosphoglucosamine mutase